MATLSQLVQDHGIAVYDYLDHEADIPVLTGPQMQGDISILPVTTKPAVTPIPQSGAVVATGQGGHDHVLVPGGGLFDFADAKARFEDPLLVGTLTVPDGCEQYLAHDEHGYTGIAPGTYRIGSQREFAGEWRAVAD